MKERVILPRDELPHDNQAIEWWYFNGFLKGKNDYAIMTCLFKANTEKVNLKFLRLPSKTVYFSHSLLFNLTTKEIKKEILPIVIVSEDSYKKKDLFINYFYPLRKNFVNYEIARYDKDLKIKTRYFDLLLESKKKPLLEGGNGYIDLGTKSTYYYSYTNMKAIGYIGNDYVRGKIWHDKQWSEQGFMKDSWLWFSIQLPNNTEIVCFDYKGKKMASVTYPNNKQEHLEAEFTLINNIWKSEKTGLQYNLEWNIKIGNFDIKTKPILKECEVNFGNINYWEGPIDVVVNGIKGKGFMEFLAKQKPSKINNILNYNKSIFEKLKFYKS
ncbi:MAG: hypothetical protein KJ623_04025 [Nanoarchaeota archaeon]|nr:hypothetical protein [Nanoarchaeota archaeon]MBU0962979.1 hypothetical protein [Nanoarchaeota archaeon]